MVVIPDHRLAADGRVQSREPTIVHTAEQRETVDALIALRSSARQIAAYTSGRGSTCISAAVALQARGYHRQLLPPLASPA